MLKAIELLRKTLISKNVKRTSVSAFQRFSYKKGITLSLSLCITI